MLKKYQWKLRKKQNSRLYDLINVRSQLEKYENNLEKKHSDILKDGDTFTVDKFENEFAILENRNTKKNINISIFKLPNNLKEGDILIVSNGTFIQKKEETQKIQNDIQSRFNKLKKK